MKYGQLCKNLRQERALSLGTVADVVRTSRSILSAVERGSNPPYCRSFHQRLMDVLRPSPDQRREIERAWRLEEVPDMTPRLMREHTWAPKPPPAAPKPLAPLIDELDNLVDQVERASKAKAYAPSPNQAVFLGTAAEVLADVKEMLGREYATRRVFVSVVVDNREPA